MCYHVSMINENIEKLLAAQKIDKERLHLIHDLEKGKVKMELDKTMQMINNSREWGACRESNCSSMFVHLYC